MGNNAVSFSGVVTNLNNDESSNIYFSVSISTLQIAVFCTRQLILSQVQI